MVASAAVLRSKKVLMLVANEELYASVRSGTIDDAVSSAGCVTNAVPGFGFQSERSSFFFWGGEVLMIHSTYS